MRDLRAEYVDPEVLHAGMRLEVAPGLSIEEASRVTDEVRRRVHEGTAAGYCFIEVGAAPRGGEWPRLAA